MQQINIEKMVFEDIELISPILLSSFDDFWTPSILKSELEKEGFVYEEF